MKRNVFTLALIAATFLRCSDANSYEIGTRAKLTYFSYQRSVLASSSKLSALGLYALRDFGWQLPVDSSRIYIDFDSTNTNRAYRRRFPIYEGELFKQLKILEQDYYPVGWMMSGAVREDDAGLDFFGYRDETNQVFQPMTEDPPLTGFRNRFCNHFYDPLAGATGAMDAARLSDAQGTFCNKPLTPALAAPAWALALQNGTNIFQAARDQGARDNTFSIADAKEAMWRAATGYSGSLTTRVAATTAERYRYWATTFRTLGDVVHVLQDMAQPQHTRNEGHGFQWGESSYEEWVDSRNGAGSGFRYDVGSAYAPTPTNNAPYQTDIYFVRQDVQIPRFGSYVDYWHQPANSAGLASYSNRGFLTRVQNIGNLTNYASPPHSASHPSYTRVRSLAAVGTDNTTVLNREYLLTTVPDDLKGVQSEQIRMTSRTALAVEAQSISGPLPPALTASNGGWGPDINTFNDHARLQLPRAVAYSAGLIDYFFRGQFRIEPPALGMYAYTDLAPTANTDSDATKNYAFKKLAFKLTNTTPAIVHSATNQILDQPFSVKSLVAVVKFHRNIGGGSGWKPDLSTEYGAPGQSFESNRDKANSNDAYDINRDESIVVSVQCDEHGETPSGNLPVAFLPGATHEVNCDFSNEPIPVGSSDLYLQVVARGTLGGEVDAVVVQTIDISEPATQVDGNAGDWFEVNGQLYRPSEITGTVLQGVRAECRGATAPNPGCVAPSSLTTLYLAGAAQTPFFKSTVPSRRFARVAFLLPVGTAALFGSPNLGCTSTFGQPAVSGCLHSGYAELAPAVPDSHFSRYSAYLPRQAGDRYPPPPL